MIREYAVIRIDPTEYTGYSVIDSFADREDAISEARNCRQGDRLMASDFGGEENEFAVVRMEVIEP